MKRWLQIKVHFPPQICQIFTTSCWKRQKSLWLRPWTYLHTCILVSCFRTAWAEGVIPQVSTRGQSRKYNRVCKKWDGGSYYFVSVAFTVRVKLKPKDVGIGARFSTFIHVGNWREHQELFSCLLCNVWRLDHMTLFHVIHWRSAVNVTLKWNMKRRVNRVKLEIKSFNQKKKESKV